MTKKCRCCSVELDGVKAAPSAGAVGDGLCPACRKELRLREGVSLQEFIDNIIVATIVLDANGSVQTVNEKARTLFNKDLFFFRGNAPGKVFECEYAEQPEGCGGTVHCSGCGIRLAITETFATGNPVFRRETTLRHMQPGEPKVIHYYISTRKRGDAVLLQIEEAG